MCTPIALGAVAVGLGAAGAAMEGAGNIRQAEAAAKTYEHNARVELMLEQEELRAGREEQKALALEVRKVLSRQTMASRGIDFSSAFFDNIYDDTLLMAQLDSELILENARRKAWGHRAAATGLQIQAAGQRSQIPYYGAGIAFAIGGGISQTGYNVTSGDYSRRSEGTAYRGVGSLNYEPSKEAFGVFRWE